MNNKLYKEVDIRLVIEKEDDPETVIRTLGQYHYIDRVSPPIENDPLLLFIKHIEIMGKPDDPEELIDLESKLPKQSKFNKIISKIS